MMRGCGRVVPLALVLGLVSLATGCQRDGDVTQYSVPREVAPTAPRSVDHPVGQAPPTAPAAPVGKQRMVAAIVPSGQTAWFFKMTGGDPDVARQAEAFRKFIGTVTFASEEANPAWKLPEGWSEQPGNQIRYATIIVPGPEGPVEVSVTKLRIFGEYNDYVLMNVDRWRQQVGLPPTTKEQLFGTGGKPGELTEIKLAGPKPAALVELAGVAAPSPMGGMPGMAGMPGAGGPGGGQLPPSHPPIGGGAAGSGAPMLPGAGGAGPAPGASKLAYATPEGWTPGKVDGMRQVAFEVHDGDKAAEVTVIALGGVAGDLLSNVNRWREQIHLPKVDQAAASSQLKEIAVDGSKGYRVEMMGPADAKPREGIVGVICTRGDQVWFIKMKGDAPIVERERAHFDAFVGSVKFDGGGGGEHVK